MESYKVNNNSGGALMDGVERRDNHQIKAAGGGRAAGGGGRAASRWCGVGLRILAMFVTFAGALVVGLDKQTKIVPYVLSPNLPAINVPVTAKYHYMSAFLYLMVANAIASGYAILSLILTLTSKKASQRIVITDVLMVGLLFSALGAGGAVGLLGFQGNSHVQWNKVCNVFTTFCDKVMAALLLSLVGSVIYLLLALLGALNRHTRA